MSSATEESTLPVEAEEISSRQTMYLQTATYAAWVSGVFTAIVAVLLIMNMVGLHQANPANNVAFAELLEDLKDAPTSAEIKEHIRTLDFALRIEYFRRQAFGERGAWLLFLGAIALYCSLRWHDTLTREPHKPRMDARVLPVGQAMGQVGRRAVSAGAGLFIALGASLYVTLPQAPARFSSDVDVGVDGQPIPKEIVYPTVEVLKKQWASFRGFAGSGIARHKNIPRQWNGKTGKNILWKTQLSLPGKSSPIVWDDYLFVTGAGENQRMIYAISTTDGKLLWGAQIKTNVKDMKALDVLEATTFAAPTPVTDGRHVYAIFATGDVAAVNFRGKIIWHVSLTPSDIGYGYASSLVQFENVLIIQYDQATKDDGKSVLIGLDTETGEEIYRVKRPVGSAWSSPIIAYTDEGAQVITCSNNLLIGSDPKTGKMIWSAAVLAEEHAPSPTVAGGMVYAVNEITQLSAIRLGGKGDVTDTHLAWEAEDGLANIPSPLATSEYVYMIGMSATAVCYDAKTGIKYWEQDVTDGGSNASPSLVGDAVYFLTADGVTIIIKNGKKYEEIGRNPLGEKTDASPAFQAGRIYMRSQKHVFAIGKK